MKKQGMDKTSVVMVVIFAILVIGAAAGFVYAAKRGALEQEKAQQDAVSEQIAELAESKEGSLTAEDIMSVIPNAAPGSTYSYFDDDGELKTVTIPMDADENDDVEKTENASKYKFEKYTDLTDKFMEVCKAGDVKELYNLYYGDFLDGMRINMEEASTVAEFEAGIKSNMLSVTGFEEYEYGTVEMPPTQSPASYANYIYSRVNNGKTLPLKETDIEDCVNLVVYINNVYQTNHFMAKIGGYWYFIV